MPKRTISLGDLITAAYDGAERLAIDAAHAPKIVALAIEKLMAGELNAQVVRKLRAAR